jgi:hypothetical protein
MSARLNMSRSARRGLTFVGAAVFALAVGGAGSAVAAPTSGSIDSMSDMKGAWLTSLTGFQDASPISWQHRMTVRKVKGSAAVAWEEWRNCTDHATECQAGTATGDGWGTSSRVLMVMDPKGVVHGVGATGTILLTPDGEGMTAVMLSNGQRDVVTAVPDPKSSGQSPTAPRLFAYTPGGQYALTGPMLACPS